MVELNIAINSYHHALVVSNEFVKINGSVLKNFEKDSRFQATCASAYVNYPIPAF